MFDQIKGPKFTVSQSRWMIGLGLLFFAGEIARWFLRGRFDPFSVAASIVWAGNGLFRLRRVRAEAEYDRRMAEALAPTRFS